MMKNYIWAVEMQLKNRQWMPAIDGILTRREARYALRGCKFYMSGHNQPMCFRLTKYGPFVRNNSLISKRESTKQVLWVVERQVAKEWITTDIAPTSRLLGRRKLKMVKFDLPRDKFRLKKYIPI
jgi:hypothetical protein